MARLKIGDIVEFKTAKGYAYAHYTHKDDQYGSLLRVYSRIYEEKPSNINSMVNGKETFSCFFPLSAAVSKKIVTIVGNVEVSQDKMQFPIFRSGLSLPDKPIVWWLWDGQREWRVGTLTQEQTKLPVLGIWNDTLIIERIESGWTPEKDVRI